MAKVSIEQEASKNIKKLLDYATKKLYLQDYDYLYVQNILLDELHIEEPYEGEIEDYDFYDVMDALSTFAVSKKIIKESEKINFETKLIGFTMPTPSKTVELFDEIAAYEGPEEACNMLFKLGEDSAYLRRKDLNKNIIWENENDEKGNIIITINLSKPEKTQEQVKAAKLANSGYPKCLLCAENLGFAGNAAKPARQTIRTIPFELDGEKWFMQYSPYQYFDHHLIAVANEHRPMCVNKATFRRMLDFIDMFPHFFIGSNAALPIVGGSILAHDHFQGGNKVLPVFNRPVKKSFQAIGFADVNISIVDWYNSIIRVESKNRKQIVEMVSKIYDIWSSYDDESVNIISSTKNGDETIQHNAITPIVSINKDGEYQFDLVLRNNRTNDDYPFGIFHPTKDLHNIKQESIGIIEVLGLFILPGRLASEATLIRDILTSGKTLNDYAQIATDEQNSLYKHWDMIVQLVLENGTECQQSEADTAITSYINKACERILECTAVFKNDEKGQKAFDRFIDEITK